MAALQFRVLGLVDVVQLQELLHFLAVLALLLQ
jgi:hypothetical protein